MDGAPNSTPSTSGACSSSDSGRLARAVGRLGLRFERRGAATIAARRAELGCLKVRLPRPAAGAPTTAVLLNTAGGITAGDRLDQEVTWEEGADATVCGQTAERMYRADQVSPPARIWTRLVLAEGASGEWLPQETILFDRCRFDRSLLVELAPSASFLGIEALVFGREAMGERVARATVRDRFEVRRAGRLILSDRIRLDGGVAEALARPAVANGARAVASIVAVRPGIEAMLEPVREACAEGPAEAGASAWDGMLVVRLVARDAWTLRLAAIPMLSLLRGGRPLPRTWQ